MNGRSLAAFIALAVWGGEVAAQSIAEHVAAVGDGWAALEFTARPGVCGHGRNIMTFPREREPFWQSKCETDPVRVLLEVHERRVVDIDTYVGGAWLAEPRLTRLGRVSAPDAADYLLDLVETAPENVARRAVLPARLADSVEVWPRLLQIAKDASRPTKVRKAVIFWLSQEAGARAGGTLEGFVDDATEDREVRESAIFAISRLPDDEAVPRLVRIAREHPDARMRRRAVFWLGRSEDPRALALIEELLLPRPPD